MTRNGSYNLDRRKVLKAAGVAGVAGLAGCIDDDPEDDVEEDDDPTVPDDDDDDEPLDYGDLVEGGTLRTALAENIDHFDPTRSEDTTSSMADSLIYEGMVTTDADGQIWPWLATGWEEIDVQDVSMDDYEEYAVDRATAEDRDGHILEVLEWAAAPFVPDPDDLVLDHVAGLDAIEDGTFGMGYQFDIREGVQFHDGSELTAENVVGSYERYFHAHRAPVVIDPWFLGVEQVDEYTINLYAQEPDADFLRSVGISIWPDQYLDEPPGAIDPREDPPLEPIGTGAFQFDEFEDETFYRVTRYEDHWFEPDLVEFDVPENFPNQPAIEAIEFDIVREDASRAAAIQAEEVDHTYGLSAHTLDDYDASALFDLSRAITGGYDYLQYPHQWDPWGSEEVRQGVNRLIPRPAIVENVYHGNAVAADMPLPPIAAHAGTHDYDALADELAHFTEHDPDEGAALVEEGFDDEGIEPPHELRIVCNADNDDRVRWVELIIESLEATGLFELEFETFEWGRYTTLIIGEEFRGDNETLVAIGLASGWSPDGYARAVAHIDNIGGCCNITGYENPEVSEQIDEARFGLDVIGEENLDNRRDLYEEIWEQLLVDQPAAYIQFGMEHDVTTTEVKNWQTPNFNSVKYISAIWSPATGNAIWIDRDD